MSQQTKGEKDVYVCDIRMISCVVTILAQVPTVRLIGDFRFNPEDPESSSKLTETLQVSHPLSVVPAVQARRAKPKQAQLSDILEIEESSYIENMLCICK